METRTKSCADRISEEYKKSMKDIEVALKNERRREEYLESVLAVSKKIVYKIELSWGGPQDYFEVVVDPDDNRVESATYHFLDWFDGAEITVSKDDLVKIEDLFEWLLEI